MCDLVKVKIRPTIVVPLNPFGSNEKTSVKEICRLIVNLTQMFFIILQNFCFQWKKSFLVKNGCKKESKMIIA